ncbi:MAG: sugar transferase [Pseudomonadota bacterium]
MIGRASRKDAAAVACAAPPFTFAVAALALGAASFPSQMAVIAPLALVLGLALGGACAVRARGAAGWDPRRVLPDAHRSAVAALGLCAAAGLIGWAATGAGVTHPVMAWLAQAGLAGAAAVVAAGWAGSWLLSAAEARGGLRDRVVVLGSEADVDAARARIEAATRPRFEIVGTDAEWTSRPRGDLRELCAQTGAHLVLLATARPSGAAIDELFDKQGCPDADIALYSVSVADGEEPVVFEAARLSAPAAALKRAVDMVGASLCLLVLSPLLAGIAIGVAATSRGGVFFRQDRVGLNGDIFRIYKFRSMYVEDCDHAASVQTRVGDQRVTPIGRFLRKSSLDEAAQLLNILTGEMSFIGPRPHAPGMLTNGKTCGELVRGYDKRHMVKPGLTGLAQVRGYRGPVDSCEHLQQRVDHDFAYITDYSVRREIEIALKTVPAIISANNAR